MLAKSILMGIDDDRALSEPHPVHPQPLRELIHNYTKLAMADAALPRLSKKATGAELKAALRRLSVDNQIELLYAFSTACRASSKEGEAEAVQSERLVEERKISALLTRIITIMLVSFAVAVVAGLLAVAAATGLLAELLSTRFVTTTVEIVKFIFTPSKTP